MVLQNHCNNFILRMERKAPKSFSFLIIIYINAMQDKDSDFIKARHNV